MLRSIWEKERKISEATRMLAGSLKFGNQTLVYSLF